MKPSLYLKCYLFFYYIFILLSNVLRIAQEWLATLASKFADLIENLMTEAVTNVEIEK